MPTLPERKRLTIQRLLEFGLPQRTVSALTGSGRDTVIKVKRGYIHRHCPSPREIERLKLEIRESWSEKVRTLRMRPRTLGG